MQTAGLTMSDVWAHRLLRSVMSEHQVQRHQDVEVEASAVMHRVELRHDQFAQANGVNRPYLHLEGQLQALTAAERPNADPLPAGLDSITWDGEALVARYDFTDEQLSRLVTEKGYFTTNFGVPVSLSSPHVQWQLPARTDMIVVTGLEGDPRVAAVFVDVATLQDLHLTVENSGYDLVDYFAHAEASMAEPVLQAQTQAQVQAETGEPERRRSDLVRSLFSKDELNLAQRSDFEREAPLVQPVEQQAQSSEPDQAAGSVQERMAQMQAEIEQAWSDLDQDPTHTTDAELAADFEDWNADALGLVRPQGTQSETASSHDPRPRHSFPTVAERAARITAPEPEGAEADQQYV